MKLNARQPYIPSTTVQRDAIINGANIAYFFPIPSCFYSVSFLLCILYAIVTLTCAQR